MKPRDIRQKHITITLKPKSVMTLKNDNKKIITKLRMKPSYSIIKSKSPIKTMYNIYPMSNLQNKPCIDKDFDSLKMIPIIHKKDYSSILPNNALLKQLHPITIPLQIINESPKENSLKSPGLASYETNSTENKTRSIHVNIISFINEFNSSATKIQVKWRNYIFFKKMRRKQKENTLKEQIKGLNISKLILLKQKSQSKSNKSINETQQITIINPLESPSYSTSNHNKSDRSDNVSNISINTIELNKLDDDSYDSEYFQSVFCSPNSQSIASLPQ